MGSLQAVLSGITTGSGIAALHYTDMDAMRLSAMCRFSLFLVHPHVGSSDESRSS
jgi:NO-binding membrane sensor protein with MHYT domain